MRTNTRGVVAEDVVCTAAEFNFGVWREGNCVGKVLSCGERYFLTRGGFSTAAFRAVERGGAV